MDFRGINDLSQKYEKDMVCFLRDIVKIPSESCEEEQVILRIKREMEKVGFDRVEIDRWIDTHKG